MSRDDRSESPVARRRSGAALLEVLVALTILASAAASIVIAASERARAVERARETDASLRAASAFLDAVSLWPREDLDRRIGDRAQGSWRLRIGRPVPALYTVLLVDTATGHPLLSTSLFRPESADGAR